MHKTCDCIPHTRTIRELPLRATPTENGNALPFTISTQDKSFCYIYEICEYNPWGILLTSASKNSFLYNSKYLDFEPGLFSDISFFYDPEIAIRCYKTRSIEYALLKKLHKNFIQLRDTYNGINYFEGSWSCYDVEYSLDCFNGNGGDDNDGGGGGEGLEDEPECENSTLYTGCSMVCGSNSSCKSCCSKVYKLCKSTYKYEPAWFRPICYLVCNLEYGYCNIDCGLNFP